jgi:hypothetical protein
MQSSCLIEVDVQVIAVWMLASSGRSPGVVQIAQSVYEFCTKAEEGRRGWPTAPFHHETISSRKHESTKKRD